MFDQNSEKCKLVFCIFECDTIKQAVITKGQKRGHNMFCSHRKYG